MHKLLMAILLLGSTNQIMLAAGWTPVSQAQAERDAIMSKFFQIRNYHLQKKERFAGSGHSALSSPAFQNEETRYHNEVFNFLKNIGTPVAYQILQELCASGELPKYYLNKA